MAKTEIGWTKEWPNKRDVDAEAVTLKLKQPEEGDKIVDYEERQRDIYGIEDEVEFCRECGSTEAGNCFYCKMD